MARKVLTEVQGTEKTTQKDAKNLQNRLKNLIPEYGLNKSKADELKALVDAGNKEIKSICKELSIEKLENVDGWNMTYKVKEKHNIDEDKMLAIIKQYWSKNGSMQCPYIKKVEVIDQEALKDAIFRGEIDDKEVLLALKACDTVKYEPALTVSRVKEKK